MAGDVGTENGGSGLKYISVCSGIEAATAAWQPLGWKAVCFSEIEPFPCAVLAHHYPDTPNVGDMLTFDWKRYRGKADVVIGGTPCQSFSIAGLRDGLNDDRGNLTLKFVEVCNDVRPDFIVWENVPGVLSDKTNAFGCLLAGLVGADAPLVSPLERGRWTDAGMVTGPVRTAAWRVLDAQFFGLAQRRRRVFVIACPRNGANPSEILFEFKGVPGDTPKGRKTGEEIAGTIAKSIRSGSKGRVPSSRGENLIFSESGKGYWREGVSTPTNRDYRDGVQSGVVIALDGEHNPSIESIGAIRSHKSGGFDSGCIAFTQNTRNEVRDLNDKAGCVGSEEGMKQRTYLLQSVNCPREKKQNGIGVSEGETMYTMTGRDIHRISQGMTVRRLTVTEVERLFGFTDDYTNIPYGRPKYKDQICPDGHRYRTLGNSMARNVIQWLGHQIERVSHGLKTTPQP